MVQTRWNRACNLCGSTAIVMLIMVGCVGAICIVAGLAALLVWLLVTYPVYRAVALFCLIPIVVGAASLFFPMKDES